MATLTRAWAARSRPRRWTAILHGRDEARARSVIDDILADLAARAATGAAGPVETADHALLLAEAAQLEGRRIEPFRVRQLLETAIDQGAAIGPLLGGTTGLAFAAACARMLGEPRVPCTERIDGGVLARVSQRTPCELGYTGLVGYGIYMLARLPRRTARQALEQLVARFEDRAETTPEGLSWLSRSGRFDLGLTHGASGVIALLAQMHEHGILCARVRPLLERGAAWLVAQRLGDVPRSAWSAGEPGASIALWSAARALGDRELDTAASRLAHRAAVRAEGLASIADGGLSHGSAGLAQLFNRFYQATGDAAFRDAAMRWYHRTLDRRATGDRSLWTGSIGIGLALVSACGRRAPVWDRLLLLDLPRARY